MTQEQYAAALARIELLIESDPPLDSEEGRELDALVEQVVEYEHRMWPFLGASSG